MSSPYCTVIALLCLLAAAYGSHMYMPVCNASNPIYSVNPDQPLPTLPTQFSATVEANIGQWNRTFFVTELFDEIGNRGKMTHASNDIDVTSIYDYNVGEIFHIIDLETGSECVVRPIAVTTEFLNETFGFRIVNGSVHIGTVSNFFGIASNLPVRYIGDSVVRGIDCYRWQACVSEVNNSYTLEYDFAVDSWNYVYNITPIPVQITLNGQHVINDEYGEVEVLNHIYSFVGFNSGPRSVPDEEFQVPLGLSCKGRIPGLETPTLPDYFSYYVEAIEGKDSFVPREYYDFREALYRVDFYSSGERELSQGPYSFIQDFRLEVGYFIDWYLSNCSVFPLLNNFTSIVSKAGPNNRLQIKSPNDFLFLSNDFNYSYEGVTTIRGVDVDAWIAVRDLIQLGQENLTNGVVEWFFTRPGWRITSDTSTTTDPVPWQLRLSGILNYVNDTGEMVVEDFNGLYDIFVFSTREPSFDMFDVSSVCVDPEDYHILRMAVPGQERGVLDLGQFRRSIRSSITEYANIFPLQVGSIEVITENGTHIFVALHLSSLPGFADVMNPKTADEILGMILNNTARDGRLPFMVDVSPDKHVYPYLVNPSQAECNPVLTVTVTVTAIPSTRTDAVSTDVTNTVTSTPTTTVDAVSTDVANTVTTIPTTTVNAVSTNVPNTVTTTPNTTVDAAPNQRTSCDNTSDLSPQAAGLAVGMLVVGVILGVACTIMVLCIVRCCRNKYGKVIPVRYEMVGTSRP